jgi:hypothetical protein
MKVGNACGFWGDDVDAPERMLQEDPDLDYLTLDYLAEVSLSIMAIQREKDPSLGYARDFLYVVKSLIPYWKAGGKCKLITNGGGLNPEGLAEACLKILEDADVKLKIGVITGDDVLNNPVFPMEGKEVFNGPFVTANAYIGAKPISIALDLGANIVIAGRIADPSLTVGPCLHHFRWAHDAYNKIAGGTIAGHLIECGTQVTGGISTDWMTVPDIENIGYPIAEIFEDGSCIITKPLNTGGRVSERTVKEQLLYEIGDPSNYKSPDVTLSFLNVKVTELEKDRVRVEGALGSPPPFHLKVSATYRAGFKAEATLALFGEQVIEKARRAGEIVFKRVSDKGFKLEKTLVETIGSEEQCMLRLAAQDPRKEALEVFVKQIAPLVTSGPQGTTGYISGRAEIRPVFGFWPCLIEASVPKIHIDIKG